MILSTWWVWVAAAIGLGILEIFVPAYVFLGFAIGAAATGLLMLIGAPIAATMGGSVAITFLVFAVLSLIAWIVLRRVMGVREGQSKVFDRDINED